MLDLSASLSDLFCVWSPTLITPPVPPSTRYAISHFRIFSFSVLHATILQSPESERGGKGVDPISSQTTYNTDTFHSSTMFSD